MTSQRDADMGTISNELLEQDSMAVAGSSEGQTPGLRSEFDTSAIEPGVDDTKGNSTDSSSEPSEGESADANDNSASDSEASDVLSDCSQSSPTDTHPVPTSQPTRTPEAFTHSRGTKNSRKSAQKARAVGLHNS